MAMAALTHLLSVVALVSLFGSPVLCRRTILPRSPGAATAVLDVSASLERAARALSFDPKSARPGLDEDTKTASSSSALSLMVHSRDFLPAGPSGSTAAHGDYRTLTLARLRRDSARVDAIAARVSLAVAGVKRSDLKPVVVELQAEAAAAGDGIKGPVVSGTSQGSGEYFARVGVGRPAKPLYMVLDTGSDVSWIQCQPCADCYQQSDPVFDPAASTTYATVPCAEAACRALDDSACRNSTCLYQVSYGDGSFTVGELATETLTFGASPPVSGVAVGCGHDNEGLFAGAAGLLALGGGPLSFPSQLPDSHSFAYCLVDRDSAAASAIEFGPNSNGDSGDGNTVTAPLLRNQRVSTYYYVGLTGISVGGEMLSIPSSSFAIDEAGAGGVIVDSGTAVTRLRSEAYGLLRDAFRRETAGLPTAAGVALFDTCYDLSSRQSVEVPAVAFHFPEGRELRLPAKNYLIPVDSAGTFCLGFAPTSAPLSIVGNVQQQGTRVAFDVDNSVVGFTPNKC